MLDQLESLDAKFQEIEAQLQDPAVVSDMKRLRELSKLRAELEPVVEAWHLQRERIKQLGEVETILTSRDRKVAGMTAPAHGLVLQEVFYPTRQRKSFTSEKRQVPAEDSSA